MYNTSIHAFTLLQTIKETEYFFLIQNHTDTPTKTSKYYRNIHTHTEELLKQNKHQNIFKK